MGFPRVERPTALTLTPQESGRRLGGGGGVRRTPTCRDFSVRQLWGVRWGRGRVRVGGPPGAGQVAATLHAGHFLEPLAPSPAPRSSSSGEQALRIGEGGARVWESRCPKFHLLCSGLFCVKCASPRPPPHDPVSLGWPRCPAMNLTWLPFTVTLAETTHTLTRLGCVNCPPCCSAAWPSLGTPPPPRDDKSPALSGQFLRLRRGETAARTGGPALAPLRPLSQRNYFSSSSRRASSGCSHPLLG